jgi:hypothetical protein
VHRRSRQVWISDEKDVGRTISELSADEIEDSSAAAAETEQSQAELTVNQEL